MTTLYIVTGKPASGKSHYTRINARPNVDLVLDDYCNRLPFNLVKTYVHHDEKRNHINNILNENNAWTTKTINLHKHNLALETLTKALNQTILFHEMGYYVHQKYDIPKQLTAPMESDVYMVAYHIDNNMRQLINRVLEIYPDIQIKHISIERDDIV